MFGFGEAPVVRRDVDSRKKKSSRRRASAAEASRRPPVRPSLPEPPVRSSVTRRALEPVLEGRDVARESVARVLDWRDASAQLEWRVDSVLERWLEDNLLNRDPSRRPGGALLLVGPRRSGKTTWARQFGSHLHVTGFHCPEVIWSDSDGYVVCDDVRSDYLYAKEVLSGQMVVTMHGANGSPTQFTWGRPCIWTCDEWDDPRKWSLAMEAFVKAECTVFDMHERGWSAMYEEESESEEESGVEALSREENGVVPDRAPYVKRATVVPVPVPVKDLKKAGSSAGEQKKRSAAKAEESVPDFLA